MQTMGTDGLGYLPLPDGAVLLHLLQQHHRDHPGRAVPRERALRDAAGARARRRGSSSTSSASRSRARSTTSRTRSIPPGVPKAILPLVVLIEFVSTFIVRPFSLMVRLFANMLAGHLILVTFAALIRRAVGGEDHHRHPAVLVRAARRDDRLRDPRELPAGVHLHDPHRRVHRQLHAPRALTTVSTRRTHVALLHLLLAQAAGRPDQGSDRDRSRHRLRRRRHRPRHRHRPRGRQRHHRDGAPARVGRHRPNHDVPRHRVHRGARALRLRPRVHHLRLKPRQERTVRKRIRCTDRSRSASSVVAAGRSPRPRSRQDGDEPKFADEAAEECVEKLARRAASTVDDCQKAPIAAAAREQRDHLGLARVRRAARRHVEVRRARGEEHGAGARGPHPQRPRGRREGARPRPRPRRRSTTRRSPTPATRPAASSRRRARRPSRCGATSSRAPSPRPPRSAARAQADIAQPARAGAWPSCGPTSPQLSIDLAERIVERNLDRDTQPPARRQLHRPGREQLVDGRPHRGRTRRRCSRSRRPRATSARSRTSCSASRGSSRATTSCAWRSSNPGLPADRRAAIVDELLENRALHDRRARSRRSSSAPAAVTTCPRSSTASSSSPRETRAARGRRGALRGPARRRAGAAARRRRSSRATEQAASRSRSSSTRPSSAASSPRSATP